MGTYNFFGSSNATNHSRYDVNPYYIYGNTISDPALGQAKAIATAGANLVKYEANSDAVQHYYDVMRKVDPKNYNNLIERAKNISINR